MGTPSVASSLSDPKQIQLTGPDGQVHSFQWDKATPPTDEDYNGMMASLADIPKESLWQKAQEPLTTLPSKAGKYVADLIDPNSTNQGWRGYASAYAQALGDVGSSLTSPLNAGIAALTEGSSLAGGAAAKGAESLAPVAKALKYGSTVANAGLAGQGLYNVVEGQTPEEKIGGGIQAVLGGVGAYSTLSNLDIQNLAKSGDKGAQAELNARGKAIVPEVVKPEEVTPNISPSQPIEVDTQGVYKPTLPDNEVAPTLENTSPAEVPEASPVDVPEAGPNYGLTAEASPEAKAAFEALVPDRYAPDYESDSTSNSNLKSSGEAPVAVDEIGKSSTADAQDARYSTVPSNVKLEGVEPIPTGPVPVKTLGDIPEPGTPMIDTNVPHPGTMKAPGKSVGAIPAEAGRMNQILSEHPETYHIAEALTKAADDRGEFDYNYTQRAAPFLEGLDDAGLQRLGKALEGTEPAGSPDMIRRVNGLREILNELHERFPAGANEGKDVGYRENYFSKISKEPPATWKGRLQTYLTGEDLAEPVSDDNPSLYGKKVGDIDPSIVKERNEGDLPDREWNAKKVYQYYVDQARKTIIDKPALDIAQSVYDKIPKDKLTGNPSRLSELARKAINHFTNYDENPATTAPLRKVASTLGKTQDRALLGLNYKIKTLHLAQLGYNVFPQVGLTNLVKGIGRVLADPHGTLTEPKKLGLLQGKILPSTFKTAGDRVDSVINLGNYVENFTRAVTYNSAKAMYEAKGLAPDVVKSRAVALTKEMLMNKDAARAASWLTDKGNVAGGALNQLVTHYHNIPAGIVEQYVRMAKDMKNSPGTALRMTMGAALLYETAKTLYGEGDRTLSEIATMSSPIGAYATLTAQVISDLKNGEIGNALADTSSYLFPAGQQTKKLLYPDEAKEKQESRRTSK